VSLPLLISVPHAGLQVPPEAAPYCILTPREIAGDGDEGAAEIYSIASETAAYLTTDIARAIVDLNRAEDDRRPDGVVKTHTCWNVPVYDPFPPADVVETLLARYYRPYHERLRELARQGAVLGVDCHTMAAQGPPVGPDPGAERPWVCLSDAGGRSCPAEWTREMQACFAEEFPGPVKINDPFQGGFITRTHAAELPWMQLELSRGPFLSHAEKRVRVLRGLRRWCEERGSRV